MADLSPYSRSTLCVSGEHFPMQVVVAMLTVIGAQETEGTPPAGTWSSWKSPIGRTLGAVSSGHVGRVDRRNAPLAYRRAVTSMTAHPGS